MSGGGETAVQKEAGRGRGCRVVLGSHKDPPRKRPAAQEEEEAVRSRALKLGDPVGMKGPEGGFRPQQHKRSAAPRPIATHTEPPRHLGNTGSAGQPRFSRFLTSSCFPPHGLRRHGEDFKNPSSVQSVLNSVVKKEIVLTDAVRY